MAYHHHHHQHLNYLHSSYDFSTKTNSSTLKFKAFLRSYLVPHIRHVLQALTKAKSMVVELVNRRSTRTGIYRIKRRRRSKRELFSSIKPYLHRPSSHITPIPDPPESEEFDVSQCLYYDSTWNSMISTDDMGCDMDPPASEHLHWLDEKTAEASTGDDDDGCGGNEIDRLAEKFIASCYEKFRLEKQESYRRYQEMLARSM
ncbi:hypothetical protein MUK42_33511 [Musa troglodytarum]|uniref:Cotton fiber protein n=1 Tax=Musa troglodytarum TaxID=320322 RepID=A0A9E7HMA7_9LILI|nr:hypothetical protein MUK42_33511 [Musa troglodytarum]